jgi:hypothetical protein
MQQAILQALLQMRLWPSPRPTRWTRARKRFTPTSRRARFQISSERPVSAGASRRLRQGTEAHEPAHTRRCDAGVVVQAGQVTSLPCHRPRRHDEVSRCAGDPGAVSCLMPFVALGRSRLAGWRGERRQVCLLPISHRSKSARTYLSPNECVSRDPRDDHRDAAAWASKWHGRYIAYSCLPRRKIMRGLKPPAISDPMLDWRRVH